MTRTQDQVKTIALQRFFVVGCFIQTFTLAFEIIITYNQARMSLVYVKATLSITHICLLFSCCWLVVYL